MLIKQLQNLSLSWMLPRFPVWQYTSYSNTSCHVFSMLIWYKHPSHLHAFISCLPCIAFNAFNNCFIWSISSEIKTNLGLLPSLFLPLINPRWFRTSLSLTAIEIYFGSYVLRDMWKRLFIPKSHPAVMMSPAKHGMGSVGLLPNHCLEFPICGGTCWYTGCLYIIGI